MIAGKILPKAKTVTGVQTIKKPYDNNTAFYKNLVCV